ncbi:MAG: terminase large subunit [Herbinix sp.]|nr:terminase large subunit [Herbinix sp.]
MIKYPLVYNPVLEYWNLIESGQEVVSKKIYYAYQKIIKDLNDKDSEYFYSNQRANHAIEFIENYCKHSKGEMGGKPVLLELWQKAMIAATFGFIDIEGNRKYHRCILIIAKKNGKSLLASAIGLYLMIADSEPGAECYAVATKKDQSKIIWSEAKKMVRKSPALLKRIKPLVAELNSDTNDSIFKPLASDSDSLDGLNVHGVLMDEIHQWKNGQSLYSIMVDGTIARRQPLILITSTAGTIRQDIYDTIYSECERIINGYIGLDTYIDDRTICFIYELDDRKEWKDPKCWKKANPNIGVSFKFSYLEEKVNQAKQNDKLVKNLLCKHFDMPETGSESWLTYEQLNNKATYDLKVLKPKYGIAGIDLSSTTDLTCATVIFRVPNDPILYVKQMYWLPSDRLEQKIIQDKVPYDIWIQQGLLRLSEGNKINYKDVTKWLLEVQNEDGIYIYKIGYDRYSATYLVDEIEQYFGKITVPIAQGAKTFNIPMRNFSADLEKGMINYNNNPISLWNLANASVTIDTNQNMYLCKTSDSTKRIDGVASLLDAYIVYLDEYNNYIAMTNY